MSTRMLASSAVVALLALLVSVFASTAGISAQSTPTAEGTPAGDEAVVVRPAHIHEGTCPDVGDVVFPLNDLTPAFGPALQEEIGTPVASPAALDAPAAADSEVVAESTTEVEASLDEILGAEHAINVHESPENIDVYIACGDITGTAEGGELQVQLEEVDDSGFVGVADLTDNGDGTTTVRVSIMYSDTAATPAG